MELDLQRLRRQGKSGFAKNGGAIDTSLSRFFGDRPANRPPQIRTLHPSLTTISDKILPFSQQSAC